MTSAPEPQPPKLLDRVRGALRVRHYSIRTEQAYVGWIRRYILFHGRKHPSAMGSEEINAFLTHLAVEGDVAVSTQNQALSALLFLYRERPRKHRPSVLRPLGVADRDLSREKVLRNGAHGNRERHRSAARAREDRHRDVPR